MHFVQWLLQWAILLLSFVQLAAAILILKPYGNQKKITYTQIIHIHIIRMMQSDRNRESENECVGIEQ